MFPLLKKDGLTVPYILISVVFICLVWLSKDSVLKANSGCEIAVKDNKEDMFKLPKKYFIVLSSIGKCYEKYYYNVLILKIYIFF